MTRIRGGIAVTGVLALAVAGCASTGDPADTADPTSASPTETAPPSQTPSTPPPTPTTPGQDAEDPADPATWEIEDGELGPIELGDDFDEVVAALPGDWVNDDSCAWVAYWSAPDGSYLVSFQRDAEGAGPVIAATVESLSDRSGIGPRTEDGLGVGATREEVLAVYPDAVEVDSPIEGISFLRIDDDDAADGSLFFQYSEGEDGAERVAVTTLETPAYEACA